MADDEDDAPVVEEVGTEEDDAPVVEDVEDAAPSVEDVVDGVGEAKEEGKEEEDAGPPPTFVRKSANEATGWEKPYSKVEVLCTFVAWPRPAGAGALSEGRVTRWERVFDFFDFFRGIR